jgi:phosphoglycolate phosphatase
MAHFFDFVFSEKNIFSKDTRLKFIVKIFKLRFEDVIYVGDEIRDMQAAKKARLKGVAVSWGYTSPKILQSADPSAIVYSAKQLLKTIKNL